MTIPMPESGAQVDARAQLAREWTLAIGTTAYVPMSRREIEQYLLGLVNPLLDALAAEPLAADAAQTFERVGEQLVAGHFTGPQSLHRTIEVLGRALPANPELGERDKRAEKVLTALGALVAGYVRAMRMLTFDQQEDLKRALLKARQDVERDLRVSEARFRGVFASTAVGIAITGLDGNFVEINHALTEMLGYSQDGLAERTIYDLIDPDDVPFLRIAYRDLADSGIDSGSFRLQRRMKRADGETAWVFLAGSVLRDADGSPAYLVTLVEDISELHLLQDRLSHQALHDVLTGLPNRQYFRTSLERVLGRLEPTDRITLLHLDLDGFSVINDGLGHQVGDRLLQVVTGRLGEAFADERTVIARVASDEFAVLVENSPTTPDVSTLATRINDELTEPAFIDDRGVAVSATIGVVQRQVRGVDADELIRAADSTLRLAKAHGKRQWAVFDGQVDAAIRERFTLAAAMPGALESGEFRVAYQPQIRLDNKQIAAVEATLWWDHPEHGAIPHDRCMELAEQTGLVLPLGEGLLRSACEQAAEWHAALGDAAPPLSIHLAAPQANDPDLVREVRAVLHDTDLPAERLHIGIPVRSLLCEDGDADDNLEVLADMGLSPVLVGFGGGHGGLAFLEDLPVRAVMIAGWLVGRVADRPGSVVARGLADLVALVHACQAEVITCNIETATQADWWRKIGADLAQGSYFGAAASAEDLTALLQSRR